MLWKEKIFLLVILLWRMIDGTHGLCLDMQPRMPKTQSTSVNRMVFEINALWDTKNVKVSFINGNRDQQALVRKYAPEWTPHSGVHYDFIDQPNAGDIRVSFYDNLGSWSLVGTQSRTYSFNSRTHTIDTGKAGPSMNLAVVDRKTILHEFGHALGLYHEHQNPAGGIEWDEAALYQKLGGPPNYWSPEQVRSNIIQKYRADQTNGVYDRHSIMHYWIDAGLTKNRCCGREANDELSPGDKEGIAKLYKNFKKPTGGSSGPTILWNGKNWAHACDFRAKNIIEVRTKAERCGPECEENPRCTHFTWTKLNGGTCRMKTGSASKKDAFHTNDETMVCGLRVGSPNKASTSGIPWNGNNWAHDCDFPARHFRRENSKADQCGQKCQNDKICTHFTWTDFNGGSCWMRKGRISKADARSSTRANIVCGVRV